MLNEKPELVVGAGWWESLSAALDNGADAVYFGIKGYNLRANARSFELNELKKVIKKCRSYSAKAYLTLNSIFYQDELDKLKKILREAKISGIDAVICWDFAVISEAARLGIPVHISTQASVSNFEALKHYVSLGAESVVLARELTLEHICEITEVIKKENLDVKIETFVHGAMCISISGRCFISEFFYNRSANRGDCLQPCRRRYRIYEIEEGHELEAGDGYLLSPRDMAAVKFLDKVIGAGVSACKIEGRTRPAEYIAVVTKVYRSAIDDCVEGKFTEDKKELYYNELKRVYNRGFSDGFYFGRPVNDLAYFYGPETTVDKVYLGEVTHFFQKINVAEIYIRNDSVKIGDNLLIVGKTTGAKELKAVSMEFNNRKIEEGNKGERIALKVGFRVRKGDKVFKIIPYAKRGKTMDNVERGA